MNFVYGLNVTVENAVGPDPTADAEQPDEALPDPGTGGSGGAGGAGGEGGAGGAGDADPSGGRPGGTPRVCLATVVAKDGSFSEELECQPALNDSDCECYGAGERAGTYEVTATLREQSRKKTVTVKADDCHVIPESLTFTF